MSIDRTKLSRDFYKHPITRTDGPTKDDIVYIFSCNPHMDEVRAALNTTNWTFYKWATKYGVSRPQASADASLASRVDYSKLSRDYRVNPLQYKEMPPKEDVEYLHLELHLSCAEISLVFGRGATGGFGHTCLTHYGIPVMRFKEGYSKGWKTYKERTGYDHPYHNPEFLAKMQEKYGAISPLLTPEARAKMLKNTNSPEAVAKAKETRLATNLERYGTTNSSQRHIPKASLAILRDKEALAELYEGRTTAEVGEILKVSDNTIGNYLRKHGIEAHHHYKESAPEREIKALLPDIKFKTDRTVIAPLEIDIYSPEHKIGIEFNGNYWHSVKCKPNVKEHQQKSEKAEKAGVFLFHVFEYEWENPRMREVLEYAIKALFNKYDMVINADQCTVGTVQSTDAAKFLYKYTMEGDCKADVHYGLYYNNDLMALMSFVRRSITKGSGWEVLRMCTRGGVNVVGAYKALFDHFKSQHAPDAVMATSDLGRTLGNEYKELGFVYSYTTSPDSMWVKDHRWLTKEQARRTNLIKDGLVGIDDKRTDDQILQDNGYYKLHDCGKRVWYYKAY